MQSVLRTPDSAAETSLAGVRKCCGHTGVFRGGIHTIRGLVGSRVGRAPGKTSIFGGKDSVYRKRC